MAEREIVKKYSKEGFNIVWKPAKCIHSGICVKTLPKVYRPGEKPWIQPESATVSELRAQIDQCPSGALAYEETGGTSGEGKKDIPEVQIIKGGPIMVRGSLRLETADGGFETLEGNTAFCRCGASSKKPFCDGSHRKVSFD
jgi:uncharacterized Fe-S cluster protein YjdI